MTAEKTRKPRPKKIKFSELGPVDQIAIKTYLRAEEKPEEYPRLSERGLKFLKSFLGDTEKTGRTYDPRDFIKVLEDVDQPIKTKLVIEKLTAIDPKYSKIHFTWAREILLQLADAGEISGGLDPNFGGYVWSKKKQEA